MLPVKPFNDALLAAFTTADAGLPWRDHLVLLLWGCGRGGGGGAAVQVGPAAGVT
ncbi:hypothetical protein SSP24_68390 [Streptomyces spinoverrucosus]|uniref:Uncharacterized protein n=1 Tax=Streptomyces spinoverrucosus TaxID=284043 RepID=A0A4Y3VQF4_9ACTN|nr:hypothetical protein [Streptomyces spinoverrucosus]GEC09184.1 hypothetical protein SSP24_68390 [Streptomyces spinoverrucosus]GHB66518.1 hypothetical protein GCM10010397_40880 [Streptomyces spinoverrucosus]